MAPAHTHANSTELDEIRRRIERWRETRPHRNVPMPAALWAAAVAAARQHGLYVASRSLHVDYGALKTHVEAADAVTGPRGAPTFVHVPAAHVLEPVTPMGCVIEIVGVHGTRRIQLRGLTPADLLAVARMAWSAPE